MILVDCTFLGGFLRCKRGQGPEGLPSLCALMHCMADGSWGLGHTTVVQMQGGGGGGIGGGGSSMPPPPASSAALGAAAAFVTPASHEPPAPSAALLLGPSGSFDPFGNSLLRESFTAPAKSPSMNFWRMRPGT